MADAQLFSGTKRFKQAVDLINRIDARKLPVLINRVIQRIGDEKSDHIFTEEEETQIKSMIGLTQPELETMIDSSSYIFDQSAYHNIDEVRLKASLEAAGLSSTQAQIFGKVWAEHKAAFLAKLAAKTFGAPDLLTSVSWRLHMTLGQEALSKTKDLSAVFNLQLEDATDKAKPKQNVVMELSRDQIQDLYEKMETIQAQLDALSAK